MEIQSETGPLVANPMRAPINTAKLVKPIVWEEKLYGGAAKFWLCVKLIVKYTLADHETTNAANSMMGNAWSFQGIQKSLNSVLSMLLFFWSSLNCCFDGVP